MIKLWRRLRAWRGGPRYVWVKLSDGGLLRRKILIDPFGGLYCWRWIYGREGRITLLMQGTCICAADAYSISVKTQWKLVDEFPLHEKYLVELIRGTPR